MNVGTGLDISIRDLAYLVADFVGYNGLITWDVSKPDGTPKKQLDVKKINSIGWRSKISLKKGLRDTIDQYMEEKY